MDNQEIQRQIDSISADIDALERTKNKLIGDSALLVQQIAEAKKPKLRHGDFGINRDKNGRITLFQNGTSCVTPDKNLGKRQDYADVGIVSDSIITPLGNIFDLMKNDEFIKMLATLKRKQS